MEKKTLKSKYPLSDEIQYLDYTLLNLNIPSLVENMKLYHAGLLQDLNSKILLKSPGKQIVLTVAQEGTEIESFQTGDSITFQILEGKLKLHTRNESVMLDKGQYLTLHEKIKYSLTTTEDSVFLLTIAHSNMQPLSN